MATATKTAITFQSSGTNTSGSTTTGSSVDLTTVLEAGVTGVVTNGGTGPTVGCDFIVEVSNDNSTWTEFARATTGVTNSAVYTFPVHLPCWVMYARTKFVGNTGQSVTVAAHGSKVSSMG